MKSPMSSNLVYLIERAIDDCYFNGVGHVYDGKGLSVYAEWTDSKNDGYSVMIITLKDNGVMRFSYCDYGTQCK